uniref:Uncharacterized protein n=1 Tax=Panagrolaimus sp. JU765 TaxID=591449 RepID=A0AC34RMR5_9BILA
MMYKNLKKIESESLFNGEVANKISIQQMDMVLQRQLYGICYPVVRKRLWQSSKLLSSMDGKFLRNRFDDILSLFYRYEPFFISTLRIANENKDA